MRRRNWLQWPVLLLVFSTAAGATGLASAQTPGALTLDEVLRSIVKERVPVVTYVETRHLSMLDQPLVAKGEMQFTPPDQLEKRAISPRPERMSLKGQTLSLERGGREVSIQLSSQPQAQGFVDSIRALLMGQRDVLERSYAVRLSGELAEWKLTLYPKDADVEKLVKRIDVQGERGQIRQIEYSQAGGDRTVMEIAPKGRQP
ncbi:hypothetical protein NBRC116584_29140 [Hydrogenophaga sp. 5NK40-0174]